MNSQTSDFDTTSWTDIVVVLWRAKWLVIFVAVFGSMSGLLYSISATKWYRADVLLVPTTSESTGGLSANLGAIGGLIGLAGLGNSKSSTTEAIALLGSGDFIGGFIADRNLLPVLFDEEWDLGKSDWVNDDPAEVPDVRDGVKLVKDSILIVSENPQTGLVQLSIEWKDPIIAAGWANSLVDRLNEHMRQRTLEEAESNIDYLESQLRESSVAPLRASISNLLESEHEKVMLAKGNSQFAFRVIDSAKAPKRPDRPRLVSTVAFSTLLGIAIGALFALGSAALTSARKA